jgi:hypothetical protein
LILLIDRKDLNACSHREIFSAISVTRANKYDTFPSRTKEQPKIEIDEGIAKS